MKISLGFSPCPNDTFIFDGMIHGKVDTEGLEFQVLMADVEELNRRAMAAELDVTKLSYHAFAHLLEQYVLLDAGSALGNNCGPLLIARHPLDDEAVREGLIGIPGRLTTANFLLSLAYPDARRKKEMIFSEIENAVLDQEVRTGLIIHENRFTYQEKGLVRIIDLGEYWESLTGMPIPLGGIVVRRSLPAEIQQKVNRVMARSVAFALDQPAQTRDFVRMHAQEMKDEVMFAHIGLYVNDFTLDLGMRGKEAVQTLFDLAVEKGIIPKPVVPLFLNPVGRP